MTSTISYEKRDFRARLKDAGLSDLQIEDLASQLDKRNRHMDIVSFVAAVERYGISRGKVYSMLRDGGIEDAVLINVFSRADLKKAGMDEERMQEVVFSD